MCAKVPHGRHDLLSEAGQQGKEGLSKVGAANYGEENTWREDDKDQKEGKHEGSLLTERTKIIRDI